MKEKDHALYQRLRAYHRLKSIIKIYGLDWKLDKAIVNRKGYNTLLVRVIKNNK